MQTVEALVRAPNGELVRRTVFMTQPKRNTGEAMINCVWYEVVFNRVEKHWVIVGKPYVEAPEGVSWTG